MTKRFILFSTASMSLEQPSNAPAFNSIQMFFVGLSGALVVMWVVARVLHPTSLLAVVDWIGRPWVAGLILYFVLLKNAPAVILLF